MHRSVRAATTMEVDFGESWVDIAGVPRKVKYLVATLPFSNAYFAKAYTVERLEQPARDREVPAALVRTWTVPAPGGMILPGRRRLPSPADARAGGPFHLARHRRDGCRRAQHREGRQAVAGTGGRPIGRAGQVAELRGAHGPGVAGAASRSHASKRPGEDSTTRPGSAVRPSRARPSAARRGPSSSGRGPPPAGCSRSSPSRSSPPATRRPSEPPAPSTSSGRTCARFQPRSNAVTSGARLNVSSIRVGNSTRFYGGTV